MQTSNPVFRNDPFGAAAGSSGNVMTIGGTVGKTVILLVLALASGGVSWMLTSQSLNVLPIALGAAFVGFLVALLTSFKPQWSMVLAPIYALLQGAFVGAISAYFNAQHPGIALAAAGGTAATLSGLLFAYQIGLIRATDTFKRVVISATIGIAIFYVVMMVLRMFGVQMPAINGSGLLGIGFSVFVVIIAALNLILDFDVIEQGAQNGAPKYMEWYGAFALMVTLIWLYLEILRLLAKIMGRR